MTITEIRNKVFSVLDSRNLAAPSIRKNALNHVLDYVKTSNYFSNGELILPQDKNQLKRDYETHKGTKLNDAESSLINEMYKQYGL